jgi:hypothetical protein
VTARSNNLLSTRRIYLGSRISFANHSLNLLGNAFQSGGVVARHSIETIQRIAQQRIAHRLQFEIVHLLPVAGSAYVIVQLHNLTPCRSRHIRRLRLPFWM